MTTNYGLDMWSQEEIDETRTASGLRLVAQDAYWRLQTPRSAGILAADAPNYGIDLLELLGSCQTASDAAALPGRIRNELTNDERILTVDSVVTATTDGPATVWDISIRCTAADGPFELVGTADSEELDLAVKLLPQGVE